MKSITEGLQRYAGELTRVIPWWNNIVDDICKSIISDDGNPLAADLHVARFDTHMVYHILTETGYVTCVPGIDDRGRTPCHAAAGHGDVVTLKLLIDEGYDVSAPDNTGMTPVHHAALNGRVAALNVLIASGCDAVAMCGPLANMSSNITPAHFAAFRGHTASLVILAVNGCDTARRYLNTVTNPTHIAMYGHTGTLALDRAASRAWTEKTWGEGLGRHRLPDPRHWNEHGAVDRERQHMGEDEEEYTRTHYCCINAC